MKDDDIDLDQRALEAYIFLYPLVLAERTRATMTSGPANLANGHGPANTFHHVRAFPTAEFRDVVRPNFDTLYSLAWLDLDRQPMVVTKPATPGRYILLPCYDMWSDVFAVPGSRTSGSGELRFALCAPGWTGSLPPDVERVDAPTPQVFIIGRTQANGVGDYDAVHAVQDQIVVEPLSHLGRGPIPSPESPRASGPDPMAQVSAMDAATYFSLAADVMRVNAPHVTDWSQVQRMAILGIRPGEPFDLAAQTAEVQAALRSAQAAAPGYVIKHMPSLVPLVNGWAVLLDTMGTWGNYYLKRAIIALVGLGANPVEDAIYPLLQRDADAQVPDGSNNYVLRFEPGALPPVHAFWSVTMYDQKGFQVANDINRFALGDRDNLVYGDDGSLELYLQHARPVEHEVANWLPTPAGPIGVTMRLYWPQPNALDGSWSPPPLARR